MRWLSEGGRDENDVTGPSQGTVPAPNSNLGEFTEA